MIHCGTRVVNWSAFSSAVEFLGTHVREIAQVLEAARMLSESAAEKIQWSGDLSAQGASRLLLASREAIRKNSATGEVERLRTLHELVSLFPDF